MILIVMMCLTGIAPLLVDAIDDASYYEISLAPSSPPFDFTPVVVVTNETRVCSEADWQMNCNSQDCYCYFFEKRWLTWSQARNNCQLLGAELASVHSEQENNFLNEIIKLSGSLHTWIGLNSLTSSAVWSDETLVTYTNWDIGQPSDRYSCGVKYKELNPKWISWACDYSRTSVCKKIAGPIATETTGTKRTATIIVTSVVVVVAVLVASVYSCNFLCSAKTSSKTTADASATEAVASAEPTAFTSTEPEVKPVAPGSIITSNQPHQNISQQQQGNQPHQHSKPQQHVIQPHKHIHQKHQHINKPQHLNDSSI